MDYVQILGELGIAYWINGAIRRSFETFESFMTNLFVFKDKDFGEKWIRLHVLSGHVLGYISSSVARDRVPEFLGNGEPYSKPVQGFFTFNTKDMSDLYSANKIPIVFAHMAFFADGVGDIIKAYDWSLKAFDLARRNGDQQIYILVFSTCAQYSLINFKIAETLESTLLLTAVESHTKGTPQERYDQLRNINLSNLTEEKPSGEWDAAEEITITFAIVPLFMMVLSAQYEQTGDKTTKFEMFKNCINDYIPKASKKGPWELVLEICIRIIDENITERELIDRGNTFGRNGNQSMQILCILGLIYITRDPKEQLKQIINIFPYLTKVFSTMKSIIKFGFIPYLKDRCIHILKNSFVGNREELNSLVDEILNIKISDKNAIQLILQQVIREVPITLLEDRRSWLFEFKEI